MHICADDLGILIVIAVTKEYLFLMLSPEAVVFVE
jgi:hypothetical protein